MTPESFRKERGLTQEQLGEELGGFGKTYISGLETGAVAWTVELALKMQLISGGIVRAADLVPQEKRELIEQFDRAPEGAGHP